jgi:hypothetical protein
MKCGHSHRSSYPTRGWLVRSSDHLRHARFFEVSPREQRAPAPLRRRSRTGTAVRQLTSRACREDRSLHQCIARQGRSPPEAIAPRIASSHFPGGHPNRRAGGGTPSGSASGPSPRQAAAGSSSTCVRGALAWPPAERVRGARVQRNLAHRAGAKCSVDPATWRSTGMAAPQFGGVSERAWR